MENNRPRGREKNVTGQASSNSMKKRGEGLGTGPVGRKEGYSSRPTSRPTGTGYQSSGSSYQSSGSQQFHSTGSSGHHGSSNVTRAGGIGLGGIILIVLAFLLFSGKCSGGGGGGLLSGLLGGGGSQQGQSQQGQSQQGGSSSDMFSGILGSLMGGNFSGGGTVSTGWVQSANTGKLNTSVAEGSRAKRTQILGNGRDVITMMVYMCGTDLESKHGMGTNDLQEMLNAKFGDNINLIVFTGGCKQWKNNVVSSSVNQVYKVENGGLKCLVQDAGRDSMTRPEVLTSFIQFCKQNYPANRYQLILWDHGCGSVSGYGYDEKNASSGSMSLKGINDAIRNSQTTFDFIGFDACLMATLETGLMLEPYADYMIASEETEPGVGWYYTNWLTALGNNTSMPTVELGKMIVDEFVAECGRKCAGQSTTLSIVDLAELGNTVEAKFSDFAVATTNQVGSDYQVVSNARSKTREFAASSRIDQIDLVHLAYNLNTPESKALADAILGAVKYNKTSSNMTNSYGLSIFFPYKKSSKVDSAVATYNAIGMDSAYSRCIQQFASMGVAGQAVGTTASAGGVSSPLSSLLGGSSAGNGSAQSAGGISSLLGGLLGGGGGGGDLLSSLTGGSSDFFGRSIGDKEEVAQYISNHYFDPNNLVWKTENGKSVMQLSEDQWNLVQNLQLNVFYDDGSGYIDLGMDNIYDFTKDGKLIGEYDGTWLAINDQPVAYYVVNETYDGNNYVITGRVPVLLNGDRAELLLVFTNEQPKGYIAGARPIYINGETETIAKGITELNEGDKIDFVCDYYDYDGNYVDSYMFGEQLTYSADMKISDVYLPDWQNAASATYLFTDLYAQEYWTPVMSNMGNGQTTASATNSESYEIVYTNAEVYKNSIGTIWVQAVVQLKNTGSTTLYLGGSASLDLEDSSGKLIDTIRLCSFYPDVLQPNETALMVKQTSLEDYTGNGDISVIPHFSAKQAKIDCVRLPVSEEELKTDTYNRVSMMGRVQNSTPAAQKLVYVVANLYDKDNKALGQLFTILSNELQPTEKIGFELTALSLPDSLTVDSVARYETFAFPMQYQF